ncbi:hypothetical protein [Nonomuraea longicatena]|uniref:Uncharacterized protein n=1 Tax=Nonomuraea longicatena TaxID=83682 RepID=A0ABN1QVJ3_9ACTN
MVEGLMELCRDAFAAELSYWPKFVEYSKGADLPSNLDHDLHAYVSPRTAAPAASPGRIR